MKYIHLILSATLLLSHFTSTAENVMITSINTRKISHEWQYMPALTATSASGFSNNEYPLTLKPEEKYLISEPIRIAGYKSVNIDCRYYVGTTRNHPIAIEFVDMAGNTVYSSELDGNINQSTMTIGSSISGITCDCPIVNIKLRLSNAYNSSEYANINELQVYGEPLEWSKREITVLPYEITGKVVKLNWVTVADAEKYEVTYIDEEQSISPNTLTITQDEDVPFHSVEIKGIEANKNYTYTITAYHQAENPLVSSRNKFMATASTENLSIDNNDVPAIHISSQQFTIKSDTESIASLYSITGIKVKETTINYGTNTIAIPSGMYILVMPEYRSVIVIP